MDSVAKANSYFAKGYNCAQAVFAAFAPQLGMTEEQALSAGYCFGSGMRKGEVCGAVTGALMAIGLKYGGFSSGDADGKAKADKACADMMNKFSEENGSYLCRGLLGYDITRQQDLEQIKSLGLFTSFCPKMVDSAARIVSQILED